MTAWIENLMTSLGYAGISPLMTLENVAPLIPSEHHHALSGLRRHQGRPQSLLQATRFCSGVTLPLPARCRARSNSARALSRQTRQMARAERVFTRVG